MLDFNNNNDPYFPSLSNLLPVIKCLIYCTLGVYFMYTKIPLTYLHFTA